ncbi:MAG: hypothetical protein ACR2QF_02980 [Geminicoccaceae bacterium]
MTMRDCLNAKVRAGRLTKEQVAEVDDLITELEAKRAADLGPEMRNASVNDDVARAVQDEATRQDRLTKLRIIATDRINRQMRSHPKGIMAGAMSHLVRDITDKAPWANVDRRRHAVLGMLHAQWADGIERLRAKALGLRRQTDASRDVIQALYGERVGDQDIQDIARAFQEAAEYGRKRFNAAGGGIAQREDWRLPNPHHDFRRIRSVGREQWIEAVTPMLDRSKMVELVSGEPLSDARLRSVMDEVYDTLSTDGMADLVPGRPPQASTAVANRHSKSRVLHFKDSAGWLAYNDEFGKNDLFGTLISHFDTIAKDVALIEVLGPNPDAMVRWISDTVQQDFRIRGEDAPSIKLKTFEDSYKVLTGKINQGEMGLISNSFTGVRNLLTAAQLGGAFLSATSDIGFQRLAASFNGIPYSGIFRKQMALMNPANAEDRILATQMGLIAEDASSVALAAKRYNGEIIGPEITARVADTVLRASLLSPWTQAGRWAFGMEFLGHLARNSSKSFADLDQPIQDAMTRYGISGADWDVARVAPQFTKKGANFISPQSVAGVNEDIGTKLLQMVQTETEFAVPSSETMTRAVLTQGSNPNTIGGQIARSIAMYKSFPFTVMFTHLARGLNQGRTGYVASAAGIYLARLTIGMTLFGAMAYQFKQMAAGKDPVNMDPRNDEGRRFWMASMLQGGGLGIFGDFLFSDVNRIGRGPASTFFGPVPQLIDDIARVSVGNLQELAMGEDTNAGREFTNLLRRYTPGGTLWYSRLAYERLILDQLQTVMDPKARRSFRAKEQWARRDYEQRFWWRPGRATPARTPDLEQVTAE